MVSPITSTRKVEKLSTAWRKSFMENSRASARQKSFTPVKLTRAWKERVAGWREEDRGELA